MDEITHTILPNAGSGWGGTALGAGFGGLIGSWLECREEQAREML